MMNAKTVIVAIGSPHGDDQLGWQIADRLADSVGPSTIVYKAASPIELLNCIDKTDELVICDACRAEGEVGTVQRWNWPTDAIETCRFSGTHDLPLPATLELANQLGRLPQRVTIWGVNIGGTAPAADVSPEISAVIPKVAQQIIQTLCHA